MLGIAMLVGGYTMDRLEIRQIHPASIPGLVPMGLGAAMIICSVLLMISAGAGTDPDKTVESGSFKNLFVSILLCIGYAAGLLGKMPFAIATGIFIFVFSLYFSWTEEANNARFTLKRVALIALFSVVFSAAISLLFQYGFLVRLP